MTEPAALPQNPTVDFAALPPVRPGTPLRAEWWLAMGHLRAGNETFVSLVTLISVLGVTLGVAVLHCVLAVMAGFEIDIREKILGANAHVIVMKYAGGLQADEEVMNTITSVRGVVAAAPFTYNEMMLRSRYGVSGVVFKGIDPDLTGEVTALRDQLVMGPMGEIDSAEVRAQVFASIKEPIPGVDADDNPLPGIFVGSELRETLQVVPGDVVQVINPMGTGGSMLGMPAPTMRSFRVAAVYHSGMFEYDTKWSYVTIPDALAFTKQSEVHGIEVKVSDIDDVERISREIEEGLKYPFYARHWRNMNQALFEALALEKVVFGLILGLTVLIAGMLIISNLYMMVLTKRREIAILRAMGATRGTVQRVFIMVGAVIGLVGTVLGTVIGLLACEALDRYEFPLATDVYYLSSLPVEVQSVNVVVVALSAFGVCLLATIYPAWRAASLDPVEGLRYR